MLKRFLLPALSICIIVTTLSSCEKSWANKDGLHRPDLEFVVAQDPDDPNRKCIIGNYPFDKGLGTKYAQKVEAEFENDLPIGTPVLAIQVNCKGCVTHTWAGTTYADGKNHWSFTRFDYKIIARPVSEDIEA